MADNFRFDITGAPLELSLQVAASNYRQLKVWGWRSDDTRLILYWTSSDKAQQFPVPIDVKDVIPMVKAWLDMYDYGPKPDIDGDCSRGSRVYNESWGHVAGEWQAFVAIEPAWLLHGK